MSKVLITSISKKVPLIKAVQKAARDIPEPMQVVGGDIDHQCIGRHYVDHFWEMPPLNQMSVTSFIEYCLDASITKIIPTRDGELPYFATHRETFKKKGIEVMISNLVGVQIADDKYQFSKEFVDAIPTERELQLMDSRAYVVKERYGAGSLSLGLNLSKQEALAHSEDLEEAVFQPYIIGKEISVDLYMRKDGVCHGVVCRERVLIVNGESQKTRTIKHEALEQRSAELAHHLGLYGHVMFQFICEKDSNQLFLLECNPRFGGASTASIQVGLDSFRWFFLESEGQSLPPFERSSKEVLMVRHVEDSFFDA